MMLAPIEKSIEEFDARLESMTTADAFRELDAVRRELEERLEALGTPVLSARHELDPARALLTDARSAIEKRIDFVKGRRCDEFLVLLTEAVGKARKPQ